VTTGKDYSEERADAVFAELGEVLITLGEYRTCIYVVGGWVPFLATSEVKTVIPNVRSLDIDLLVDPSSVPEAAYERIRTLLERRGFRPDPDHPHRMVKTVPVREDPSFTVALDLLAPEEGGTARSRRHQRIQDIRLRKIRGGGLVPENCETRRIEFRTASGGNRVVEVRFASPLAFLVMKAAAVRDRGGEKDAYDVAYLMRHHPLGLDAIRGEIVRRRSHPLVREALRTLHEAFEDVDSFGTVAAMGFERFSDPGETERLKRRIVEIFRTLTEGS